jgi:hypothetical protein
LIARGTVIKTSNKTWFRPSHSHRPSHRPSHRHSHRYRHSHSHNKFKLKGEGFRKTINKLGMDKLRSKKKMKWMMKKKRKMKTSTQTKNTCAKN